MRYSDDLAKKQSGKGRLRTSAIIVFLFIALLIGGSLFFLDFSRPIIQWALPLVEMILIPLIIYRIYRIVKRYKGVDRKEFPQSMDVMREALHPVLGNGIILEIVLTELSVFYYSLVVWFKKPRLPESGFYTYHKNSQLKTVAIVFVILITLETVGMHFLLMRWNEVLAWIVLALNVYGILYLTALYNSFRYLPIRLNDNGLIVNLGFQGGIVIPLNNIESIGSAKQLDALEKSSKDTFLAYLRLDTPQFEIRLKQPVLLKASYGSSKKIITVVVRVDTPHDFSAELDSLINQGELAP